MADDNLNFFDKHIYVIRKDGHYDLIYKRDCIDFDIEHLKESDKEFNEIYINNVPVGRNAVGNVGSEEIEFI
jgi:hypothetical protein